MLHEQLLVIWLRCNSFASQAIRKFVQRISADIKSADFRGKNNELAQALIQQSTKLFKQYISQADKMTVKRVENFKALALV
jgi:hypothetical protein